MKKLLLFLFLTVTAFFGNAQTADSAKVYHIGIFANLFLDSSFAEKKIQIRQSDAKAYITRPGFY